MEELPEKGASAISPLEAHIGYWLRLASNQVSHSFARKLEAEGVTVAEWVILRELFELGETAPHVLATTVGMTRGAISKLIERLVEKHYVDRTSDLKDRRYQQIKLTAVGRALVPYLAEKADKTDAEFFGDLDDAQKARLLDVLQDLVKRHSLKSKPTD